MLIQKMLRTGALAPMQREAVRLLREILERIDASSPQPDGMIRFTFEGDVALLDRLGIWGAHEADIEITGEDDEDDGTGEDCGRRLKRLLESELPEVEVSADEPPHPPGLAAIGDGLARLMPVSQPTPAALRELVAQIAA